jgi:hypothetical protein
METTSLVKNEYLDAVCEPDDEPFPGRGFERIDITSGEWSGIPAGTFLWALVAVSTVGLLTAMLIATIAVTA